MPWQSYQVEGMSSAQCCEKVEQAARAVPGVQDARTNLEAQRLEVQIADAEATPQEPLFQAIQEAGYRLLSES